MFCRDPGRLAPAPDLMLRPIVLAFSYPLQCAGTTSIQPPVRLSLFLALRWVGSWDIKHCRFSHLAPCPTRLLAFRCRYEADCDSGWGPKTEGTIVSCLSWPRTNVLSRCCVEWYFAHGRRLLDICGNVREQDKEAAKSSTDLATEYGNIQPRPITDEKEHCHGPYSAASFGC